MQRDRSVAVAESLEHGDLGPLQRDEPAEDDVQKERRNAQKDSRKKHDQRFDALDLARQDGVRDLVFAGERAEAAVGFQNAVDRAQYSVLVGAGFESHREIVEGALHLIRRSDRILERMKRNYTVSDYLDRVGALRSERPELSVSRAESAAIRQLLQDAEALLREIDDR